MLHPGYGIGIVRDRWGFEESFHERLVVSFTAGGNVGGYLVLPTATDIRFAEVTVVGNKGVYSTETLGQSGNTVKGGFQFLFVVGILADTVCQV